MHTHSAPTYCTSEVTLKHFVLATVNKQVIKNIYIACTMS